MYQLQRSKITGEINMVVKTDGQYTLCIPMVEANTDYQKYLEWLAEGNEPLPAEAD